MITYSPGYWNVSFAFSLTGSVFPKSCAWAASSSLLTVVLQLCVMASDDIAHGVSGVGNGGTNILSGFTFILGFLLVFRSQQAYSRWWEGGTLMQQLRGEWFNATSCLIAFCNTSDANKSAEVLKFQHQLVRLVSLLYVSALQQVCTMDDKRFEVIDITGFQIESLEFLDSEQCHDHCEVVLQWIQKLVVQADDNKIIKIAPPILSRVYNQLGNGIVNLNNARKITEFPIPFPLAQMITVMLLFHWCMTPLICVATVDSVWLSALLCFVVVFSYWSINYIGTELEMPFGDDANDLPLRGMQSDLNASLMTLMQERAATCPEFDFQEFHLDLALAKVNPADLANESHETEMPVAIVRNTNCKSGGSAPTAGKQGKDGKNDRRRELGSPKAKNPGPRSRPVAVDERPGLSLNQGNVFGQQEIGNPAQRPQADIRLTAEAQSSESGAGQVRQQIEQKLVPEKTCDEPEAEAKIPDEVSLREVDRLRFVQSVDDLGKVLDRGIIDWRSKHDHWMDLVKAQHEQWMEMVKEHVTALRINSSAQTKTTAGAQDQIIALANNSLALEQFVEAFPRLIQSLVPAKQASAQEIEGLLSVPETRGISTPRQPMHINDLVRNAHVSQALSPFCRCVAAPGKSGVPI